MVKVVERTPEEIAEMNRVDKLVKIVEENFGGKFLVNRGLYVNVFTVKLAERGGKPYDFSPIYVSLRHNLINLDSAEYFDDAVRLAELYEASGEPEFTVKRNY